MATLGCGRFKFQPDHIRIMLGSLPGKDLYKCSYCDEWILQNDLALKDVDVCKMCMEDLEVEE